MIGSELFHKVSRLLGLGGKERLPRITTLRRYLAEGCRFELAVPIEVVRVEQYGDEEEFAGMIINGISPGDIVFDIGACVGLIAVHAAKKGAAVYAFEPDPYYRSRLSVNLRLNGLDSVRVIEWAVSDTEGETVLFTDGEGGNSPSLRNFGERGAVTVRTDFIDNAIQRGGIPKPDILKIDIEGAEILALRGMKRLLGSESAPKTIFIEIHPDFLTHFGSTDREVTDMLASFGYDCTYRKGRSNQLHCVYRKTPASR